MFYPQGYKGLQVVYFFSRVRLFFFFFFCSFRRGGRDLGCKWRQAEGVTECLLLQRISRIRCAAIGCSTAAIHTQQSNQFYCRSPNTAGHLPWTQEVKYFSSSADPFSLKQHFTCHSPETNLVQQLNAGRVVLG